jgi:hypothetical protein
MTSASERRRKIHELEERMRRARENRERARREFFEAYERLLKLAQRR